jgi:hypothetical protein
MKRYILIICLLVIIAFGNSCAIPAIVRARQDMENSKKTYKTCLQQNLDDPSKCEVLRMIYEADIKAYQAL